MIFPEENCAQQLPHAENTADSLAGSNPAHACQTHPWELVCSTACSFLWLLQHTIQNCTVTQLNKRCAASKSMSPAAGIKNANRRKER